MTPSEINEVIAGKLHPLEKEAMERGETAHRTLPDYSGSIAAAFEIVEKHKVIPRESWPGHTLSFELTFYDQTPPAWGAWWRAEHYRGGHSDDSIGATADTAPMAICLAFLKIKE